ncbi:diaminopimelate decarboxylase [Marinospirillum alkaliphilum]|uniref:Diaminopimelate decarboxylase n=1 Tax=Marinospirillum alkaliphilum DSM 21637 TaxID=1122209 RepID=A0A1K1Y409_9GAMM|nr:diaminopimelate decarboxylase [Marinospirillum alkaliphilum]SFX56623.1 diaminopimelate decarboxylase [Marinospirillum alkaliphilum DSM 21637]
MDFFNYNNGQLFAEDLSVKELAEAFGTPLYVYSRATLERHYRAYADPLANQPHLICYAVKANSNLGVLNVLARMGAGFDIVSAGELERVLAAGGDPARVVFSGVGKQVGEIRRALSVGIKCFNVESIPELQRIDCIAEEMGLRAPVSIRVNPDVDPKTHPYISTGLKANKFGIGFELAREVYRQAAAMQHIEVVGVDCHIGSQITQIDPFLDALDRLLVLIDQLAEDGIHIRHLDLGGGLGVRYNDETPPLPTTYIEALRQKLGNRQFELVFEPGRAIAANAGILVTRVEYLKEGQEKHFAIVDAAMNDLLRPALYNAWQAIIPVTEHPDGTTRSWDIVGPVCETGDFLGKDRELTLKPGDLLAVRSAGAYGFAMASNYNSRNRPAEVMVDGSERYLVRQRESYEQQMAGEFTLPGQ